MKITLASDLHLEFVQSQVMTADADVLILSGDICVADHFTRSEDSPYQRQKSIYYNFFGDCAEHFDHVIFVMGNHEHYHGRFEDTAKILREHLGSAGITLLDNEFVDIDDVRFVGTTLWTDMNREDPMTMIHTQNYMNDYRVIRTQTQGYRKLIPQDTVREHKRALVTIDEATRDHDRCVVVGHHGPTPLSISPEFKNDKLGNGGYVSDLSEFILDRPQIKLWTHGHVHTRHDYMVGETRVVCNPGGYPHENTGFDPNLIVEI